MAWKRVLCLFPRQEHSHTALLAIIHPCLTPCKDRLPVMGQGQVGTEALLETATGACWAVLGERGRAWDGSEFRGLFVYLAAAPLIYSSLICWQQAQMAQRPVKKSIRKSVVNLSGWQVGALAEMAFEFSSLKKCSGGPWQMTLRKWKILTWKLKMRCESFWLSIFTRLLFPFLFFFFPPFKNKTLRCRKRNPCSPPREWEVNSALQE